MKEKQIYAAPEVEVVKVKTENNFLDGSLNAARRSYGAAQTETWGDTD